MATVTGAGRRVRAQHHAVPRAKTASIGVLGCRGALSRRGEAAIERPLAARGKAHHARSGLQDPPCKTCLDRARPASHCPRRTD
ncbi:conserved hypothetical protein [Methylorubrum extorquens AM1]|uniref:Uncharacterized protein n=1 Tax=Methylorubrum extorquens (strain ATCC 14718 / DSM 1338 / JCM 2805 / NCIMB 9133 / AM1) TaxID=272630 RepID=C5B2J3_METEA|nr:conserved hypothetical protein [Methylorubrum extorquens AM1]